MKWSWGPLVCHRRRLTGRTGRSRTRDTTHSDAMVTIHRQWPPPTWSGPYLFTRGPAEGTHLPFPFLLTHAPVYSALHYRLPFGSPLSTTTAHLFHHWDDPKDRRLLLFVWQPVAARVTGQRRQGPLFSAVVFLVELTVNRRPPSTSSPTKRATSSLFVPCYSLTRSFALIASSSPSVGRLGEPLYVKLVPIKSLGASLAPRHHLARPLTAGWPDSASGAKLFPKPDGPSYRSSPSA
jgi:hypothetical protein